MGSPIFSTIFPPLFLGGLIPRTDVTKFDEISPSLQRNADSAPLDLTPPGQSRPPGHLQVCRQLRVYRQQHERLVHALLLQVLDPLLQREACRLDLLLPRQEDKDVSRAGLQVDGHRGLDGRRHVVLLRRLAPHHLHRECAARDGERRNAAEEIREFLGVKRRGGDDQAEVAAARDDLREAAVPLQAQAKQKAASCRAFSVFVLVVVLKTHFFTERICFVSKRH